MKKILHPTDFSQGSHNAFEFCVNFAKKIYGDIVLMHANPMFDSMDIPYGYIQITQEEWENKAIEQYHALREEIEKVDPNIHSKLVTPLGNVIPQILETAKEESVDWIIMGTRGAEGISRWLGTKAARVVGKAECPVIVVPEGYTYRPINRIVYATNYMEEDRAVLKEVATLAGFMEAELVILHVAFDPFSDYEEKKFTWYKENIAEEIPELKPITHSFEFLNHVDLQKALNEFVAYNDGDLLVMTRKKRAPLDQLFHRSQTQQMAFHPAVPLLTYHGEEMKVN